MYDEMYTPYIFGFTEREIKFISHRRQWRWWCSVRAGVNDTATTENVIEWVNAVKALKTSMDSVTRTITDLVDNYDRSLHSKILTRHQHANHDIVRDGNGQINADEIAERNLTYFCSWRTSALAKTERKRQGW